MGERRSETLQIWLKKSNWYVALRNNNTKMALLHAPSAACSQGFGWGDSLLQRLAGTRGFFPLLKTSAAVIDNSLPVGRNFYEKKMAWIRY